MLLPGFPNPDPGRRAHQEGAVPAGQHILQLLSALQGRLLRIVPVTVRAPVEQAGPRGEPDASRGPCERPGFASRPALEGQGGLACTDAEGTGSGGHPEGTCSILFQVADSGKGDPARQGDRGEAVAGAPGEAGPGAHPEF
nr:hypothetical protein [uncultured Holophaga sp.]